MAQGSYPLFFQKSSGLSLVSDTLISDTECIEMGIEVFQISSIGIAKISFLVLVLVLWLRILVLPVSDEQCVGN